jgi:hypothetical protein
MKNGSKILMYAVITLLFVSGNSLLAEPTKQTPAFWDNVITSFAKNYRQSNPDHFSPKMPESANNIFALQNVIPSVMNLDPNLLELVIQHVVKLHGGGTPVNLNGWSTTEIVQAMTEALNRQIKITNTKNGY